MADMLSKDELKQRPKYKDPTNTTQNEESGDFRGKLVARDNSGCESSYEEKKLECTGTRLTDQFLVEAGLFSTRGCDCSIMA